MTAYASPGLNIPYIRMAYGARFEIIEMRCAWVVKIKGKVKRFNNLVHVAQYIYEQNFDHFHVYYPPVKKKVYKRKINKGTRKWWLVQLMDRLKKMVAMKQPTTAKMA